MPKETKKQKIRIELADLDCVEIQVVDNGYVVRRGMNYRDPSQSGENRRWIASSFHDLCRLLQRKLEPTDESGERLQEATEGLRESLEEAFRICDGITIGQTKIDDRVSNLESLCIPPAKDDRDPVPESVKRLVLKRIDEIDRKIVEDDLDRALVRLTDVENRLASLERLFSGSVEKEDSKLSNGDG